MFSQSFGSFHTSKQFSCFPRFLPLILSHVGNQELLRLWGSVVALWHGCPVIWCGKAVVLTFGWKTWGLAWIVRLIRASGRLKIRQLCWRCSWLLAPSACLVIWREDVSVKTASGLVVKSGYLTGSSWDTSFMSHSICTDCTAHCFTGSTWCCSRILSEMQEMCSCKDILTNGTITTVTVWQSFFLMKLGQFWLLFALLGKHLGMDKDGYWHWNKPLKRNPCWGRSMCVGLLVMDGNYSNMKSPPERGSCLSKWRMVEDGPDWPLDG